MGDSFNFLIKKEGTVLDYNSVRVERQGLRFSDPSWHSYRNV